MVAVGGSVGNGVQVGRSVASGFGVRVGTSVTVGVNVDVGVSVGVSVMVGEGVGVPNTSPWPRERYTREPIEATSIMTSTESISFLISWI